MKSKLIRIISQAFYGNMVETEVCVEDIDRFILGYIDSNITITKMIDRTIINIPDVKKLVIIYNKYEEKYAKDEGMRVLAKIPEMNIELHSRCIACRINENGEFESVESEDIPIIGKYFLP